MSNRVIMRECTRHKVRTSMETCFVDGCPTEPVTCWNVYCTSSVLGGATHKHNSEHTLTFSA